LPTFTGNLKALGIEPRNGLYPEIIVTIERAGVSSASNMLAGSRTFIPEANGDITLVIGSTVTLVPEARVKLTGAWLGDDSFFDLPPFHVPDIDGTLRDLAMNVVVGNDVVYTSPTAQDAYDSDGRRVYAGFQMNETTGDLYKRVD
jgi:hypothetical protein